MNNSQEFKILENNDNLIKKTKIEAERRKVPNSLNKTRSLTKISINQTNPNELNFFPVKNIHLKNKNSITKSNNSDKSDNKEIKKNFNKSLSIQFTNDNLLLNEKIFFPNYTSMKELSKSKKGFLAETFHEFDFILNNFQFNGFRKCNDIILI